MKLLLALTVLVGWQEYYYLKVRFLHKKLDL
jgi:hypothetical protein